MTIAIGIVCDDAILLAADMEHTAQHSHKMLGSKITSGTCKRFGHYAVTGTGDSDYLYMAMDHIRRAFEDVPESARVEDVLEEAIVGVRDHAKECGLAMDTWWGSPELLVAVESAAAGERELLHVGNSGAVHHIDNALAVGAGAAIALSLLRVLPIDHRPSPVARLALNFILHEVKASGYGCGGPSQHHSVPGPTGARARFDEGEIADVAEKALKLVLLYAPDSDLPDEHFDRHLADVEEDIREIRRQMATQPSPHSGPATKPQSGSRRDRKRQRPSQA